MTTYGVYCGILAYMKFLYNIDSVVKRTIAVQGIGNVGYELCQYPHHAGELIVTADELNGYDAKRTKMKVENIYHTLLAIYRLASIQKIPTNIVVNRMAEQYLANHFANP